MHVQGLRIRPQPSNQAQVVVELQKLSENSDNPLQTTPFVQSNLDGRMLFQGTWLYRQDRAKLSIKAVRKLRTNVGPACVSRKHQRHCCARRTRVTSWAFAGGWLPFEKTIGPYFRLVTSSTSIYMHISPDKFSYEHWYVLNIHIPVHSPIVPPCLFFKSLLTGMPCSVRGPLRFLRFLLPSVPGRITRNIFRTPGRGFARHLTMENGGLNHEPQGIGFIRPHIVI